MAYPLLDDVDRRLIGALQVDGRASPEQLADALDLPLRTVTRLLAALLRDGTVRVTAVPPRDPDQRTWVVRVTILTGQFADAITGVTAQTVLRIHAEAHQWRLPGLSKQESEAVGHPVRSDGLDGFDGSVPPAPDETERRIRAALLTSVGVDPARLGLPVGARLTLTVPPGRLDAAARALADLDVSAAETTLVGRVVKRPGMRAGA